MLTERLEIRDPVEADRARFIELFADEDFMVFSAGVKTADEGSQRFDRMVAVAAELPAAKRPIVWRESGEIIGYTGLAHSHFEGRDRLEFGWRLAPAFRRRGVGFEAASAVLALASRHWDAQRWGPDALAYIDPSNQPSQGLARKLGFEYWQTAEINGFVDQIWRRPMGPGPNR
jgi:RimJ/RimL family protein N-acetyltransferase